MPVIEISVGGLVAGMLALAFGGFVQRVVGSGLSLLALPVLAVVAPWSLPEVLLFLTLPSALWIAWSEREGARDRGPGLGWLLVGRALGTVLGTGLLLLLSAHLLTLVFGVSVIVSASAMLVTAAAVRVTRPRCLSVGVLSGVMGTTSAAGGPPVSMLYAGRPGPELRTVASVVLAVGAVLSLIGVVAAGRVQRGDLILCAALCLPMALGQLIGSRYAARIDAASLRRFVLAASLAGGCVVLVQALV